MDKIRKNSFVKERLPGGDRAAIRASKFQRDRMFLSEWSKTTCDAHHDLVQFTTPLRKGLHQFVLKARCETEIVGQVFKVHHICKRSRRFPMPLRHPFQMKLQRSDRCTKIVCDIRDVTRKRKTLRFESLLVVEDAPMGRVNYSALKRRASDQK